MTLALPTLQTFWYVALAVFWIGFLALDGYDLGAGMWYLLARRGPQRDQLLASVAPFWDGNQVWLVAVGGVTFAAFPPVYAALLSGLYPLFVTLLLALIARTLSIEYAPKVHVLGPRRVWDAVFAASSTAAVLVLGLLIGNLLCGLPVSTEGELRVAFGSLFSPFALLIALLVALLLALHGAVWLGLKTTGDLRARARRWGLCCWGGIAPLVILTVMGLARSQSWLMANYATTPGLWALPAAGMLLLILAGAAHAGGRRVVAFAASTAAQVLLAGSAGVGMFPSLVHNAAAPALSLTAFNASSSLLSLEVMVVVAALGMPLVFAYSAFMHWLFREPIRANQAEAGTAKARSED